MRNYDWKAYYWFSSDYTGVTVTCLIIVCYFVLTVNSLLRETKAEINVFLRQVAKKINIVYPSVPWSSIVIQKPLKTHNGHAVTQGGIFLHYMNMTSIVCSKTTLTAFSISGGLDQCWATSLLLVLLCVFNSCWTTSLDFMEQRY